MKSKETGLNQTLYDSSNCVGNKILFVGRNFKGKGGNVTVDIFRILQKRKPDAELWIVGTTPTVDETGVRVIENVPRNRIYEYYNECDVFCLPIYYIAFNISLPEALPFGMLSIRKKQLREEALYT